jgi:hypothetical protein
MYWDKIRPCGRQGISLLLQGHVEFFHPLPNLHDTAEPRSFLILQHGSDILLTM